jgi:hypothetical protein
MKFILDCFSSSKYWVFWFITTLAVVSAVFFISILAAMNQARALH